MGLGERLNNFPASFRGEQQRVSIARRALPRTLGSCSAMSPPVRWEGDRQQVLLALPSAPAAKQGAPSSSLPTTRLLTAMADRIIQAQERTDPVQQGQHEHPVPVEQIEW